MIENLFPFWFPFDAGPTTIMHTLTSNANADKTEFKTRAQTRFRKRYKNSLVIRLFNKSMSLITKSKSCTHSSHLSTRVRDMAFMSFRMLCDNFPVNALYFGLIGVIRLYHLFPLCLIFFWYWECVRGRERDSISLYIGWRARFDMVLRTSGRLSFSR